MHHICFIFTARYVLRLISHVAGRAPRPCGHIWPQLDPTLTRAGMIGCIMKELSLIGVGLRLGSVAHSDK